MGDGVPTDQLSHNHCDCGDSHCRSHIVASCVSLCFSSQPLSQDDGGGCLPQCLRPQAVRHGQALCLLVKTHLAKFPSQGEQLRTGKRDVCQQPIAGLTPLALCCPIGAESALRVNVDFPLSMWCCVPFCPMPYHKSIGRATSAMRWMASRATPSSSWATTMAAASEVYLVGISQDTSHKTVLWIHLLLRTPSWW